MNIQANDASSNESSQGFVLSGELLLSFLDMIPGNAVVIDANDNILLCNSKTLGFFGCADTQEFQQEFFKFSPELQPNGAKSKEEYSRINKLAFENGSYEGGWVHIDKSGKHIPMKISLLRIDLKGDGTSSFLVAMLHDVSVYAAKNELERRVSAVLKAIVDATPLVLNVWDTKMNNVICNKQVISVFGVDSEDEYLNDFYKFSPEYQPNGIASADMVKLHFERVMKEGVVTFKWMHLDAKGAELPAEITLVKINMSEDETHVVGFVRDLRPEFISDETDDNEYYFLNKIPEKTLLRKVAEISDDLFFAIDMRTSTIQYVGKVRKYQGIIGSMEKTEEAYNETYVHAEDISIYKRLVENMSRGEYEPLDIRFLQLDGSYRYYRMIYQCIRGKDDKPVFIVGKGVDIHEQKVLEEKAKYDDLTDCYSRINAEEMISQKMQDGDTKSALVFVDIDSFRDFNERYGHFFGDDVLKTLVNKINIWLAHGEIVGRLGADEFVIYVPNVGEDVDFFMRMDELYSIINDEYEVNEKLLKVKVNMGVALCPKHGSTYEYCIKCARKALYGSRDSDKKSWEMYHDSHADYIRDITIGSAKSGKISGLKMDYRLTSAIFNILYERNSDDVAINAAIGYIAQKFGAHRCFVIAKHKSGNSFGPLYSWTSPSECLNNEITPSVPTEVLNDMFVKSSDMGIFACSDIEKCGLNQQLKSLMKKDNVKSFLHAQVKKEGSVSFFLVVEDLLNKRDWSDVERNTLHYMARLLSIVLQTKHMNEEIRALHEHGKVSAFIADNTDNFIYIVDTDSYNILHLNKKAINMYGNLPESEWRGRKCYEFLHGKAEPCEFCTNKHLKEKDFYEWNYFHPRFQKTYLFKDKLVELNGKLVKLQVATDITKLVTLERDLKDRLQEQKLLIECIEKLHTNETPDVSIEAILEIICRFFDSTRGVIIQLSEDKKIAQNTHEWTDDNTPPRKHTLQNINISALQPIFDMLKSGGVCYVKNIASKFASNENAKELLKAQGVIDLLCAPIMDTKGNMVGLFGLDNPRKNVDKAWLVGSIAVFVADFIDKNKLVYSLNKLSYYDTLTNVKNRHSYRRALKEIDDNYVSSLGVVYVDITGLARINEEKGTRYGDDIIKRMACLLTEVFGDNIYRVGGDEFVVLETNIEERIFEQKIDMLREVIRGESDMKASLGFTWNSNILDEEEEAEEDVYNTVRDDRNYTAILSKNLQAEIKSGKYVVYLQPQIDCGTEGLGGAEALIRRLDANGNVQAPVFFVPFYEKEGMIAKIDLHVFETVCKCIKDWETRGLGDDFKCSVNCSRVTIMEKGIVNILSNICEKHGVDKSRFVIEITETITHADDNVFANTMSSLKNAGFCISLDDFGSGQSNLSSIRLSDFDEIKIDMGLTRDVHLDDKAKVLTKVALSLCSELEGVVAVAEGIETVEQYEVIKQLGCNKVQGYFFSKPICIADFEKKYL